MCGGDQMMNKKFQIFSKKYNRGRMNSLSRRLPGKTETNQEDPRSYLPVFHKRHIP
jgi:hypothetical protein